MASKNMNTFLILYRYDAVQQDTSKIRVSSSTNEKAFRPLEDRRDPPELASLRTGHLLSIE
jgi:hypothetical protein